MPRLPSPFGGIVPPVCTPFTEDNEVDVPSLERLSTFLLDGGVHGQLVDHLVDETRLRLVRVRSGLLELLEEIFDCAVVVAQKGDCIHRHQTRPRPR
jgi:4-hydroxy-tetrahydrodipicolinate synthase